MAKKSRGKRDRRRAAYSKKRPPESGVLFLHCFCTIVLKRAKKAEKCEKIGGGPLESAKNSFWLIFFSVESPGRRCGVKKKFRDGEKNSRARTSGRMVKKRAVFGRKVGLFRPPGALFGPKMSEPAFRNLSRPRFTCPTGPISANPQKPHVLLRFTRQLPETKKSVFLRKKGLFLAFFGKFWKSQKSHRVQNTAVAICLRNEKY